jgi:hypothetical protein
MKIVSRILLFGALTLVLLTAACAGQGTPTVVGTVPNNETSYPPPGETQVTETEAATASPDATATADVTETATTDTTQTPGVPVTGVDVILVECQFCIDGMTQTLLVIPETATFEVVADTAAVSTPGPDTGCTTVDTFNGRQIVMCRAEENTSLNLNICTNANNCTQVLVEFQDCPDQLVATHTPGFGPGTPGPTITVTPTAGATDTPGVVVTDTPGVLPTNSPNAGGG